MHSAAVHAARAVLRRRAGRMLRGTDLQVPASESLPTKRGHGKLWARDRHGGHLRVGLTNRSSIARALIMSAMLSCSSRLTPTTGSAGAGGTASGAGGESGGIAGADGSFGGASSGAGGGGAGGSGAISGTGGVLGGSAGVGGADASCKSGDQCPMGACVVAGSCVCGLPLVCFGSDPTIYDKYLDPRDGGFPAGYCPTTTDFRRGCSEGSICYSVCGPLSSTELSAAYDAGVQAAMDSGAASCCFWVLGVAGVQ
jgi:hypothetical protein